MLGQQPPKDVAVPSLVREVAGGRSLKPSWINELGGVTFMAGDSRKRHYLKWSANGPGPDLTDDIHRGSLTRTG